MNPVRMRSPIRTILFALCLFIACISFAQPARPPSGNNSTNLLAVELWLPQGDEVLHAPATISIQANVALDAPAQKGDFVRIEFYANTKRLGSRKSVWHDAVGPDPHSRKFQPMIMSAAGFWPVGLDWSNVPAGSYALTAKASDTKGRSAVSTPVNITVLPSPSP